MHAVDYWCLLLGTTGLVGASGDRGPKGTAGDTGSVGFTGLPGATGSAGPPGATGEAGLPGDTGPQGLLPVDRLICDQCSEYCTRSAVKILVKITIV